MSRPLLTLIIALIGGNPFWFQIAFWQIVAGNYWGLAAAVFGLIDWLGFLPTPGPNEYACGMWWKPARTLLFYGEFVAAKFFSASESLKVPQWHLSSTAWLS